LWFQAVVPSEIRCRVELWIGCVAGALSSEEYTSKLTTAGLEPVRIDLWRSYNLEDAPAVPGQRQVNFLAATDTSIVVTSDLA
jgi:hypothetical protein